MVYENPQALRRAYLAAQVVVTGVPDGALALMQKPGFDPARTAVVSASRPISLPNTPLQGDAQLASYTPDRVVVRTRASREALLVLADNFYAGWEARVDGRVAPILRTDHTLRGVVVPAGEHEVVFRFRPRDLYTGFGHLARRRPAAAGLRRTGTLLLARRRRERRVVASA